MAELIKCVKREEDASTGLASPAALHWLNQS